VRDSARAKNVRGRDTCYVCVFVYEYVCVQLRRLKEITDYFGALHQTYIHIYIDVFVYI